ncbi:TetR family transcriptional regulator [Flavobacterium cyanobacteriorum]|uniref:TetR family transcriptional regulator n=1 Tax=Flavobacterium cyanobacteriorum TaxID=2022802 RepID=A0A255ZBI6_9FLAO|nr:TetR/AcrR family transcriptional regulator [Flavobacterium cyanobacteriorum]OYQ38274.1 TetR family transcriptional regulator [Flavobacterium cyanobacteriorum]
MKEIILQKATEMFLRLGFKSVTMDDIAAELGISKKTIYLHFANKNELVNASAMHLFETISAGIDKIHEAGKNPIEEIFEVRNFIMQHLNDEKVSPFYQLQKFFPEVYQTLRGLQFGKMNGSMKENLRKGIETGIYQQDIDIEFVSRIYFTGLTGIKDTEIFPQSLFNAQQLTKKYLEYHLKAIATPKGLDILKTELKKLTNI